MSIESTQPTAPISGLASGQELRTRTAPQSHSDSTPVNAALAEDKTDVTLSALTKRIQTDESRDVDHARVAQIRAALEAGELPIEPKKIAQALVQDIFLFY